MRKIILAILSLVMLLTVCTGCSGSQAPSDNSSSGEDTMLSQYEKILHNHKVFFVGFGKPSEDGLPMVGGTDTRPALADVLEKNDKESGELRGLLEEFTGNKSFEERLDLTYRIMEILVAADDITDGGGLVSDKKLAAIRAFWGPDGDKDIISPTNPEQAELIEQTYICLVEHYCLSLICSMYYDYTSRLYKGEREDGSTFPYMMYFNWHIESGITDGELDEDAFYDICLALGYYGTLRYESYEAYAELRGYMEGEVIYNIGWNEDDRLDLFFPLIDKALADINNLLDGANDIDVIFGSDEDDELVGGDANELIIGGSGNDILKGGTGNDYLQGGVGDDVYVIRPNCGDDVIYDDDGANVLRFEGIPLENIYVSSIDDEGHWDDVKITFVGSNGSVTIRDYNDIWRGRSFDIEVGGRRFSEDDPESPFMFIDDDSRLPQGVMPPYN